MKNKKTFIATRQLQLTKEYISTGCISSIVFLLFALSSCSVVGNKGLMKLDTVSIEKDPSYEIDPLALSSCKSHIERMNQLLDGIEPKYFSLVKMKSFFSIAGRRDVELGKLMKKLGLDKAKGKVSFNRFCGSICQLRMTEDARLLFGGMTRHVAEGIFDEQGRKVKKNNTKLGFKILGDIDPTLCEVNENELCYKNPIGYWCKYCNQTKCEANLLVLLEKKLEKEEVTSEGLKGEKESQFNWYSLYNNGEEDLMVAYAEISATCSNGISLEFVKSELPGYSCELLARLILDCKRSKIDSIEGVDVLKTRDGKVYIPFYSSIGFKYRDKSSLEFYMSLKDIHIEESEEEVWLQRKKA